MLGKKSKRLDNKAAQFPTVKRPNLSSFPSVCICVCIYLIEHNHAIQCCHPSHSMPFACVLGGVE